MARKCKCRICGKDLTTDTAYNIPKVLKGGKTQNQYYCSIEEYQEFKSNRIKQLELLRENQRLIDNILGYTCINNTKNVELSKMYEVYSKEQINELIKEYTDYLKEMLSKKNIKNEYGKIRYIFVVLNNNAKDYFSGIKKLEIDTKEYDEVDDNVEVETKEVKPIISTRKKKKRTGLLDIL